MDLPEQPLQGSSGEVTTTFSASGSLPLAERYLLSTVLLGASWLSSRSSVICFSSEAPKCS